MIKILVFKGEGLDTEEFFLKSEKTVRISLANQNLDKSLILGMTQEGEVSIKVKDRLSDFNAPPAEVFRGPLEELLARLA